MESIGEASTSFLFVYGTLRRGSGTRIQARLEEEAAWLGPATVAGALYRVSWYPALVTLRTEDAVGVSSGAACAAGPAVGSQQPKGGRCARVRGDLFRLADPQATLAWLDEYENVVPGDGRASEYRRVVEPVRLETGETAAPRPGLAGRSGLRPVTAWLYRYNRPVSGLERIASGDFLVP